MAGHYPQRSAMIGRVGMVVPAWYAPDTTGDAAEALLETTLAGCGSCVLPGDLVVVTDGSPVAARAAGSLRARDSAEWADPFDLLELPENRGKGGALVAGIRRLLERGRDTPLEWIATRDADGDHFVDDLPHLFRAGQQAAEENPDAMVCVVGRRASVHAPLGWVRGEYEVLLNEVLIDAIAFARARSGGVWDTRYLIDRVPDLQSGYKLYSRAAAERAVQALEQESAAAPELRLLRTGMEIVPFVTLALEGGIFVEVERKTYFDQPVTSYGSVDLAQFYGSKLAWALRRCEVPRPAAEVLIDGALVRRPLFCDPDGRAGLLAWRTRVLDMVSAAASPSHPRSRRFL